MPFYPEELIEEVRSRNDIVAVIGARVKLTRKGANYFGCCPFHSEKTPSFSVSPSKQMYYCFGCGAGGNVVTFLMNYENYNFTEAMEHLASRVGITLPKREMTSQEKERESPRSRLLQLNGEAAKFYFYQLRGEAGREGLAYLSRRGLSRETLQKFGLGFAPNSYDALYRYLKEKGFSDEELKVGGLARFKEQSGAHDYFRNRVMFPIMDRNSRVIGFGGRVMEPIEPKYLNSPETPLFDKGGNLYALHLARATRRPYLLLCEGYMDVISVHQAGIDAAVASLGTALTGGHALLLKRYTDQVILCYDSDAAGIKAAMRAIPILREAGLGIRVLDLKPYKDPDEFIVHEGTEAFEKRIEDALNFFLYQSDVWKSGYNLQNPAERTAYYKKLAEELVTFEDPLERDNYLSAVCERQEISRERMEGLVGRIGNGRISSERPESVDLSEEALSLRARPERDEGLLTASQVLLNWAATGPASPEKLRETIREEDFPLQLYREIFRYILQEKGQREVLLPATVLNRYLESEEDSKLAAAIFSRSFSESASPAQKSRVLSESLQRLRKAYLQKELQTAGDAKSMQALITEMSRIRSVTIGENLV